MARLRVDVAPKNLAAGPAQKQAQVCPAQHILHLDFWSALVKKHN